ncbi:MAG: hypothetical protein RLZZ450_801 [Pseudomonadota bacterium]|jgi:tetratricopeptide (TPR) repeat protein
MKNQSLSVALVGLTAILVPSGSVHAEGSKAPAAREPAQAAPAKPPPLEESLFKLNPENPEAHLPTAAEAARAPLWFANMLNDMGAEIDAARARGDYAQSVKYERALVKVSPHRAIGYSGLCRDYEALGQRDDAIQACALAVQKEGVLVDDFVRFVRLVANRPGGVDPTELADAHNAIDHLKSDPASRILGNQVQCELSLKQNDEVALEQCSTALLELAPDDPKSITYAWTRAIKKRDFARAQELVNRAKANPQMAQAVPQMETSTREFQEQNGEASSSLRSMFSNPILRWLLGVLVVLALGFFFARRSPRAGSSV